MLTYSSVASVIALALGDSPVVCSFFARISILLPIFSTNLFSTDWESVGFVSLCKCFASPRRKIKIIVRPNVLQITITSEQRTAINYFNFTQPVEKDRTVVGSDAHQRTYHVDIV